MKKILLFASALAGLFLAGSCQRENLEPEQTGKQVTFTVEAPAAMQTKAIADGKNVDQLIYEVWITGQSQKVTEDLRSSATRLYQATTDMAVAADGKVKATITLDLVNDQNFTVLFWAQKEGINVYNTAWLDAVTYTNTAAEAYSANDNRLDAFYGKAFVSDGQTTTPTVTLKRPFAQVNLCTLNSKDAAQTSDNYNISLVSSKMALVKVPTVFNVATSAATEEKPMEFAANTVPSGEDKMITVNGKQYFYAGMNYVFAGSNITLTYDIQTKLNGTVDANVNNTIQDVPLKENYRTNIVGNLLTSKVDYEIIVDAEFASEYVGPEFVQIPAYDAETSTWTVTNADELAWVAASVNGTIGIETKAGAATKTFKGETVVLANDIDLNGSQFTPIGTNAAPFEGTFDGKGFTVKNFKVNNKACAGLFGKAFTPATIKNVTVENATITSNHYAGAIVGHAYAKIDNCHAKDVTITVSAEEINGAYDNGDKVGGICGYLGEGYNFKVTNCSVDRAKIQGYRDLGGILGYANSNNTVSGNTVKNTTLIIDAKHDYKDYNKDQAKHNAGYVVGKTSSSATVSENTPADAAAAAENNVKTYLIPFDSYDALLANISDDTWYDATKTELEIEDVADFAAFVETANSGNDFEGKTLKLTGDIDLYFEDLTDMADGDPTTFRPIGDTKYNGGKPFKGTFDGQGHTIKNLYQNGWDLNYHWDNYGSYGLFGKLEDATVKNVVIEGSESYIEGGDVSFIAGSATGNCVFEDITINSGVAATYNNGCGGIIGWSGAGNYTFKNITIDEDVVLGGLWGSFDSSIGGIVGQAEPGATYNFENVTINCRIDAYNDCTASYDYYNYRMCGMIIGRCEETTTINGANYPDLSKYNLSFNNVVVNYGDWMNYHYCRRSGERAVRVEPGYAYDGISADRNHSTDNAFCREWIPFNQLIGGDQYAVKGLPTVEGVTVNYPESFYREQGYKANGNTWTIYSGKGFKEIATTVLNDGTKNVTIELANDIDLAGIEWPAVKTAAAFVLDGKGYSIKNLTTSAVEDHGFYSTAMFTSTRKATTIKDLVVENATVTGKGGDNSHGAVLVACNYAALNIEGVTVKNSTVSNCDRSSVLVTYLYFTTATVKDCVVEGCTVNSIGTAGAVLGMNNSHNFEATGNTVKDTTISSSEGGNKAGILIGTWQNAGTLTESNNVVENSKAINAGTETNNNIGRHV